MLLASLPVAPSPNRIGKDLSEEREKIPGKEKERGKGSQRGKGAKDLREEKGEDLKRP